jgi:hypothetical protein
MNLIKYLSLAKFIPCFFLIAVACMLGCGNSSKPTQLTYVTYVGHLHGDTATAILHKSKQLFSGTLEIYYQGTYKDSGDVKGVVKGDTLIGEFHFLHYKLEWKRKPVAFLMKKDKMIMGQGLTKLTVGIPHFHPEVPIDFNEK